MACCVLGLMFFWQMVAVYRRVCAWFGLPVRAVKGVGAAAGNLKLRLAVLLRRPWARAAAVMLLGAELAVGSHLLYLHRDHLREALAVAETTVGIARFDPNAVYICRASTSRTTLTALR
jgi:hypothetical protein